MDEKIPAIRVTDPQSKDTVPYSPPIPQTPIGRPGPESGASKAASPSQGKTSASPGKLLRSLSNNTSTPTQQQHQGGPPSLSNGENAAAVSDSSLDPLSQQILRRTTTPSNPLPTSLRPTSPGASVTSEERVPEDKTDGINTYRQHGARTDTGLSTASAPKEKRKGVSFLSRIIGGTKKKDTDDASDSVSDAYSDLRPEGMEAEVFSQPVNNLGYEPRHAQPPAYIRVRARHKKDKDFDRVFLAQELHAPKKQDKQDDAKSVRSVRSRHAIDTPDTIWAMQWSRDGRYLAVAGHDKMVRVWAVLTSPEERRKAATEDECSESERHTRLSAPVFQCKPIREFEGHTATVLDLTWSKNNFLLSSSMDKTVRLWHVSRSECLCTFKHNDFVTSIAFHPKDDRFFLAGSLDSKLRLWSIPDKTVAYWNNLGDMITAVEFTPDGKYAIGGCLNGLCMFYETEGLKYQTQIHVRSTHGKNAKGSKITNIQAINYPPHSGDTKLLITSNDSRIRLYNFRDKALEIKFKGNINDSSQIRATFSDDARYIICGSEDNKAFIWTMNVEEGEKRHKRPMEYFTASDATTTCVSFAPGKTRQQLGRSEDPMYDICNPPPVTLMSMAEKAESRNSSRSPTEDGDPITESEARHTPAYKARSTHPNGHIIVTADFQGRIKVFRQDCAWAKRKADNWDSSSVFSKATGMRRTASIATRGSSRSLRSANGSVKTQAPSERILSWRQNITSTPSANGASSLRSAKTGRSTSPRNSTSQVSVPSGRPSSAKGSMGPPPLPREASSSKPPTPTSPTKSVRMSAKQSGSAKTQAEYENPLGLHGDHSTLYWKIARASAMAIRNHKEHPQEELHNNGGESPHRQGGLEVPGALQRTTSSASTLSIERTESDRSSNDEFMDAMDDYHAGHDHGPPRDRAVGSGSEVVCRHCSSNSFKAARSKDGDMRLCCTACGTPA